MPGSTAFLSDIASRPLALPGHAGLSPISLHVGPGQQGIEIAVVEAAARPPDGVLHAAWEARRARRATPVIVVAVYGDHAALCGATGEKPPVHADLNRGQAERLCREALQQPDRHAALRFLAQALPSLATRIPGIRNEGLLALHELEQGAPQRQDWPDAGVRGRRTAGQQGNDLLKSLGFSMERLDNLTQLLRAGDRRTALAVLLTQSESVEASTARFNSISPISYALAKADQENLQWVIIVQGNRLRLYPTETGVGVGRRGRTETFVECQPALLSDEHLAYLWLLFSADALKPQGSLEDLLESSRRFAGDLAERLRDRIYEEVVPRLATGISAARKVTNYTADELHLTYQMALTVLFRLLFIAYAEDRDLLPYQHNEAYRRRSLKQKAQELADADARSTTVARGETHWREVEQLWDAVAGGNPEWGVPAYDGGLFSTDPAVSPAGAKLAKVRLPNEIFEPALKGLLLIETAENSLGPVDFRSLGVREFGTIYEGLLESELSVADTNLTLDAKGTYVPAKKKQAVIVAEGEVYLHDRSGARKSSGSYFTKSFAVEHLLDRALEPALKDHFARLEKMDDAGAAESFFDFRVADIAMGSGHFLIAAIDRIEKGMGECLSRRAMPGVMKELAQLRAAAEKQLGELAEQTQIEDGQLLRRLIARRCIYGVDINDLAVQLARLSIWIHTFVPGLPLSLLDHGLVVGNSLVGVATVDEIRARFLDAGSDTRETRTVEMFTVDAESLLGQAAKPLKRLATLADASLKDVEAARTAAAEAGEAIAPTRALCDIITALPVAEDEIRFQFDRWEQERKTIAESKAHRQSIKALAGLNPLHFPVAFPEVFLRDRPGFDVLMGNPPWQEITIEEHGFWARHFPGLRGLTQGERERLQANLTRTRPDLVDLYQRETSELRSVRRALVGGAFPGMGTGDPDLYKAFCWRFWQLAVADHGRIGVVLPRGALSYKGSTEFRATALRNSVEVDIALLQNKGGWVFSQVHEQTTIGLTSLTRGSPADKSLHLRGPFLSLAQWHARHADDRAIYFSVADIEGWNDTMSLPVLPSGDSLSTFAQLRMSPSLSESSDQGWRARPDTELHATNDKGLMDLESEKRPKGFWPVFKGESFHLWVPDTGIYYGFSDSKETKSWLYQKRLRSARRRRDSAHSEFALEYLQRPETLPCNSPRIAFRDGTNRLNNRTIIACLVPPEVFLANTAPFLQWPKGDEKDQSYILGVLASIPLDWYARLFVERHVNFFIINSFPIPRPPRSSSEWRRVVALAGRLACPDARFHRWAEAVGVVVGPLGDSERDAMIHELDAVVAHLFGLSEPQLCHIFETFHEGWDYHARLDATLKHYRTWAKKRAH
jgi:hypothetical protein